MVLLITLSTKKNEPNYQYLNYQDNQDDTEDKEIINDDKNYNEDPVFCKQDVMKCPDGSYVGRELPDCKFKPCPTPIFKTK